MYYMHRLYNLINVYYRTPNYKYGIYIIIITIYRN